ncbi:hypothetical protein F949_00802 [Acinetobacter junii NIPH 182]|uniref:hypothetical protein n=1 Tax=Acinetobacter junii TaxID=40215 RepID=UPI0002CE0C0B|nr:hypothetical protein [Acinetobacter junii]ENV64710.1 hypothetical protein F949_00802 [Acinetobacter junii NIPH 182]
MNNPISFPTQGELARFIFSSSGILANRHDQSDHTQKEIEKIQTQLRRLAEEKQGKYLKNFWECQKLLKEKLTAIVQDDVWVTAIEQSLLDLFQCYLETIHGEGTFRDKKTNTAYLIELVWMPSLVISIFKYKWLYHQHFKTQIYPESQFWFLGTDQQTPLALVIDWIYQSTGHTTTSFHASSHNELTQRDLENVRHWRQGKHLPTWHDLEQTFERAMQQHKIEANQQQRFKTHLFLARWATFTLKQLHDHYDVAFTENLLIQFKQQFSLLEQAFLPTYQGRPPELEQILQQKVEGYNLEQIQEMHDQICIDLFFKDLAPCQQDIAQLAQHSPKKFAEVTQKVSLFKPIEQYCIVTMAYVLNIQPQYFPLETEYTAIENMLQGDDIISGKEAFTNGWLQQHEQSQAHVMFPWLKSWVLGRQALLKQQLQQAHEHLEYGFSIIKYSACRQHRFVEDYLVTCAKLNKKQDFDKALSWARYMDHFGQWQGKLPLDREDDVLFQQYQHAFVHTSGLFFAYYPDELH